MKKPIYEIPGTVAYVLMTNKDKWCMLNTANDIRNKVIELVNNNTITIEKDREDFISRINHCKNTSGLMSTLCTYMTGLKVN